MKLTTEVIAAVAHEANRVYCESLGDFTQDIFTRAPEWQRTSAYNGVEFILSNPGVTPEQSHENWMKEKAETGWTYGPVKDAEAKTHPCLVPYAELPEEQRLKDAIFQSVVRALINL